MPDEPRRIYWDACVFLDYIEGAPQWMPILDALLEQASETADLVIYTSTVSITDGDGAEPPGGGVSHDGRQAAEELARSPIQRPRSVYGETEAVPDLIAARTTSSVA
jgi:hypothetical protein